MSATVGWAQQLAENARQYQQFRDRVAQLSLTETSRDGVIQVTVSASGVLTDLVLRERGRPRPLAQLAAEIMDCVKRAQARIPGLLHSSITATVGEHDAAAQLIVADAKTRFPEPPPPVRQRYSPPDQMRSEPPRTQSSAPPPPLPHRPQATPPTAPPPPADEDWDERPLMEEI